MMKYEYEVQELWANRDGNRIFGEIYIPQGAGEQMPAVIYSHGFAGNYQVGVLFVCHGRSQSMSYLAAFGG